MELIKSGRIFNFMKYRRAAVSVSTLLVALSAISLFYPGPNWGIDFSGGTEVQLRFAGDVTSAELRGILQELNYASPDVVAVQGADSEYIVRVREFNRLPETAEEEIASTLVSALGENADPQVRVSPGGDKLTMRFASAVDRARVAQALSSLPWIDLRGEVTRFGPESDHRYEANLAGVADELVRQLREALGDRGPETPLRIEWVGPRAGQQLRNAAIQALLYTIAMVMVYVAFRFDLRFAPGGILALLHDAMITVGVFVLVRREFNLTTVASLLTIVGYSINDTIVIYDRIRENMARHRGKTMAELINISTSEMLSRTLITTGVTLLSLVPFFIWGTQVIQDIAFALTVGFISGVYSTIYIASPVTEWLDTSFFKPMHENAKARAKARGEREVGVRI